MRAGRQAPQLREERAVLNTEVVIFCACTKQDDFMPVFRACKAATNG